MVALLERPSARLIDVILAMAATYIRVHGREIPPSVLAAWGDFARDVLMPWRDALRRPSHAGTQIHA